MNFSSGDSAIPFGTPPSCLKLSSTRVVLPSRIRKTPFCSSFNGLLAGIAQAEVVVSEIHAIVLAERRCHWVPLNFLPSKPARQHGARSRTVFLETHHLARSLSAHQIRRPCESRLCTGRADQDHVPAAGAGLRARMRFVITAVTSVAPSNTDSCFCGVSL